MEFIEIIFKLILYVNMNCWNIEHETNMALNNAFI